MSASVATAIAAPSMIILRKNNTAGLIYIEIGGTGCGTIATRALMTTHAGGTNTLSTPRFLRNAGEQFGWHDGPFAPAQALAGRARGESAAVCVSAQRALVCTENEGLISHV